jgi:hypothetical protein
LTRFQGSSWQNHNLPVTGKRLSSAGDGPPVFAHINQLWQDYADPIAAKLRLVHL